MYVQTWSFPLYSRYLPQNKSIKAAVMNDDILTAFDGNFLLDEGQRNHWAKLVYTSAFINAEVPIPPRRLCYEENCFKNVQPAVWQWNIL